MVRLKRKTVGFGISALLIVLVLYLLIQMLQRSDAATIRTAREIDAFITRYCEDNSRLPAAEILHKRFPNQNVKAGWFFFTDDKTFLKMQYPVKWWNEEAIGRRRLSEFTATPYAYQVDYRCKQK